MISAIIPVYQNEKTLFELHLQLKKALSPQTHEILFIDDVSQDRSRLHLQEIAAKDPFVRILSLKEHRGQHRAVIEGIKESCGELLIVLDADLQDPPEEIGRLLREIKEGHEAVFAGRNGTYESFSRLATSKVFKFCLHHLCQVPRDAGMFVALTRKMAQAALQVPMEFPFLVAMIGLTGLPITSIPVKRAKRCGEKSTYTHWMRLKLALKILSCAREAKKRLAHNQSQKEYYSRNDHSNISPENHPHYIEKHIGEMLKWVPKKGRVLEVGCGSGRFTIPLAKRGIQIEGADLSEVLITKARNHSQSKIPFHVFDLLSPPESLLGQFDAVIGFFILHHLCHQNKTFKALFSLLKPGGKIAFIEPNPYNPLFYLQIALHPKMRWKNERYILSMRPSLLKCSMEKASFSSFSFHRFGFFPPLFSHVSAARSLEEKLEKVPLFYSLLPFQVFHGTK